MKLENLKVAGLLMLSIGALGFNPVWAESDMEEVVVKGDLGSLPGERVESIFGFEKSILDTPRSASTISEEMMDRFNMQDIDELVVLAPGTFTQSFFGVAGSWTSAAQPVRPIFGALDVLITPATIQRRLGHPTESTSFVGQRRQLWALRRLAVT